MVDILIAGMKSILPNFVYNPTLFSTKNAYYKDHGCPGTVDRITAAQGEYSIRPFVGGKKTKHHRNIKRRKTKHYRKTKHHNKTKRCPKSKHRRRMKHYKGRSKKTWRDDLRSTMSRISSFSFNV